MNDKANTETEYVKISRANFVRLTVVGVLVSVALSLWQLELLPVVTSKNTKKA